MTSETGRTVRDALLAEVLPQLTALRARIGETVDGHCFHSHEQGVARELFDSLVDLLEFGRLEHRVPHKPRPAEVASFCLAMMREGSPKDQAMARQYWKKVVRDSRTDKRFQHYLGGMLPKSARRATKQRSRTIERPTEPQHLA